MARLPAAKAGIFFHMEPLVGTLLGVLVVNERLGGLTILGGVMIIFWGTLLQYKDFVAEVGCARRRTANTRTETCLKVEGKMHKVIPSGKKSAFGLSVCVHRF
jgi:hypothetical protein